jgi:hypothetical protein
MNNSLEPTRAKRKKIQLNMRKKYEITKKQHKKCVKKHNKNEIMMEKNSLAK